MNAVAMNVSSISQTPSDPVEDTGLFSQISAYLSALSLPEFLSLSPSAKRDPDNLHFPGHVTAYRFDAPSYYARISGRNRSRFYDHGKGRNLELEADGASYTRVSVIKSFDEEKSPRLDALLEKGWFNKLVKLFAGPVNAETLEHGESVYGNISYSLIPGECPDWSPIRPIHNSRKDPLSRSLRLLDEGKPGLSREEMFFPEGKTGSIGKSGGTEVAGIFPGPWDTHRVNTKDGITEGKQSEFMIMEWAGMDYGEHPLPAAPAAMLEGVWLCFRASEGDRPDNQPILQAKINVSELKLTGQVTVGVHPSDEKNVIRVWGGGEAAKFARGASSFTATIEHQPVTQIKLKAG